MPDLMMERTNLAGIWPPTAGAALAAGHKRTSPLRAIRGFCVECGGGQPSEARRCEAISCALWPFRAGRHPWFGHASAGEDAEE